MVDGEGMISAAIGAGLQGVEGAFVMLQASGLPARFQRSHMGVIDERLSRSLQGRPPGWGASSMGANRPAGGDRHGAVCWRQAFVTWHRRIAFVRAGGFSKIPLLAATSALGGTTTGLLQSDQPGHRPGRDERHARRSKPF